MTDETLPTSDLTVCAVICTRNRPVDLARTLRSLEWQDRQCSEVLIVDDSDPDRRHETVTIAADVDLPIRVISKETPGLTASRNLALDEVSADIVLFLDDDVVLRPDYVARLVEAFAADPALAGAGGSIDDDHEYELPWLRALFMVPGRPSGKVYPSGWSSQTPKGCSAEVDHLIGCNMAYRTSLVGDRRFSEDFQGYALGEDLEFSFGLRRDGHRLAVVGDARLWHLTNDPRKDLAWGYREVAIRPIVARGRFNRAAFLVASLTFLATNAVRNRQRARGNALAIVDVILGRPPRGLQTLRKGDS